MVEAEMAELMKTLLKKFGAPPKTCRHCQCTTATIHQQYYSRLTAKGTCRRISTNKPQTPKGYAPTIGLNPKWEKGEGHSALYLHVFYFFFFSFSNLFCCYCWFYLEAQGHGRLVYLCHGQLFKRTLLKSQVQ
jgi:hypothetical protein